MEVGDGAFGVPRIANPADHLSSFHGRSLDEIGPQTDPQTVIGAVLIVVQVDVIGLPAVGVLDDGPAAIARPTLLCDAGHDAVGGGHDGSEPWSGDVVAFVLAGATIAVGTERRADLAHSG